MKRLIIIIFIILSSLMMGCNIEEGDIKDRLNSPENKILPIEGKWIVEKQLGEAIENDPNIGMEILFHNNGVIIGSEFTYSPNFKYKRVNSYDYLIYKYKISPRSIGFENSNIDVITLYGENQYLYEFIKYDDESLYIYKDNRFYKLENILETVSIEEVNRYIDIQKNAMRTVSLVEENKKTGLLLGIKSPIFDDINNLSKWKYETVYIDWELGMVKSIYRMDDILLPRKNGFYKVHVNRKSGSDYVMDKIEIESLKNMNEKQDLDNEVDLEYEYMPFSPLNEEEDNKSILKNIQFLGNDYISIETINLDLDRKRMLEIHLVDNFSKNKPMRLSDIIGEEGSKIFAEGAQNEISLEETDKIEDTNIGLSRRNGYWMFKGRINYRAKEKEIYKDFDIKAIPPEKMVSYDQLLLPWSEVKKSIPDAKDMFFSPNEDFLIVVKKEAIYAYPIDEGMILFKNGLKLLEISDNASIIMAEWARGEYVELWENEIVKNGGYLLEY